MCCLFFKIAYLVMIIPFGFGICYLIEKLAKYLEAKSNKNKNEKKG